MAVPTGTRCLAGGIYHIGSAMDYQGELYEGTLRLPPITEPARGCAVGTAGTTFTRSSQACPSGGYTDARLAELDAPEIELGGKLYTRYEISQLQRALKRRCEPQSADIWPRTLQVWTPRAAVQLKGRAEEAEDFTRTIGGYTDSFRGMVYGFGHSAAAKAMGRRPAATVPAALSGGLA